MGEIINVPTELHRTLLHCMADTLIVVNPDGLMDEGERLSLARRYAERWHHRTPQDSHATECALLVHAPAVRPGATRDEYAAVLRLVAEGVTA
ncbi:hypothetical protein [Streptomyces sp. NBC_01264]|uniref:hypothetical protein n=1 Tax=Streptomyces sp. NBC_01264 TaxID=2903804 RepID=UPI002250D4AA|nr:hypothetical protein [Streptomyces sp. NBC_01264]MCX4780078.1 hypothetical protein [Streptomyces sp. NBC_01264]